MTAYAVRVEETVVYEFEVEADNVDEAEEVAIAEVIESEDRDKWATEVTDRSVTKIREKRT